MVNDVQKIIAELKSITGLTHVFLLNDIDKLEFKILEDTNNLGVRLSLDRKYSLVVVHDSRFRSPRGSMVLDDAGKLIFPPLPFPEINAWNVTSSSPSVVLHNHLINIFGLNLADDEATLIVGFDL
ncbi:MAG: hypothetical protein AABW84_00640 [Nanoarchaeota archaeon]